MEHERTISQVNFRNPTNWRQEGFCEGNGWNYRTIETKEGMVDVVYIFKFYENPIFLRFGGCARSGRWKQGRRMFLLLFPKFKAFEGKIKSFSFNKLGSLPVQVP